MKYFLSIISILLLFIPGLSCKKFLDKKSDQRLAVPSTLADAQALLDNYTQVNNFEPPALEICSGDFYLTDADLGALFFPTNKRLYAWEADQVFEEVDNDWYGMYRVVYYANTVLETLKQVEKTLVNEASYNSIRGQALFHRGRCFLELASLFSLAYDSARANRLPGIPLRLNTNFNEPSVRANLSATYQQIREDLHAAAAVLPATALHKLRPSRAAAFAMLARYYLYKQQFAKAGLYADSSLQINNTLINYNSLNAAANFPFTQFNAEVLFSNKLSSAALNIPVAKVDSNLYRSYASDDLRKSLFFRNNNNGTYSFKGSYEGTNSLHHGPTTGEMYLTRAECYARQGNVLAAMNDLNELLLKRWRTNAYTAMHAPDAAEVELLTAMKLLTLILLLVISFTLFAQGKMPGNYRDHFSSRIQINADGTYLYTWSFDLSYSWTKGTWTVTNDTIYFQRIATYDTISYTKNDGIPADKLVLSVDKISERLTPEQYAGMGLSSGGQSIKQSPIKLFYKRHRLYNIKDGKLVKQKLEGFWSRKKWNPWFFKSND